VWVHDYHLISLGAELRALGVRHRLGFFLHIPFPPPELLQAVPAHNWLVETLFQFDVIGFQTTIDLGNFRRFVTEHVGGKLLDDGRITAYGRTIIARSFPIGIDVDDFAAAARTPEAASQIERLNRRTIVRSHIIGVDRLDYTKGLPERFRAFRKLLELHPEHLKTVTLMQIAPPTRIEVEAYVNIRTELEQLSGAINGEFGDFDWTPVRYVHRSMSRDTLAALFRGSEVGLVTPLRDGMNLVAKEYIAAQNEEDPGVLILSKFAGAAEELEEALIVNPYNIDAMANAMQTALRMPIEERKERHAALLQRIKTHDVCFWRRSFLDVLNSRVPEAVS
jgi:trehalose 6-phosphate synthase